MHRTSADVYSKFIKLFNMSKYIKKEKEILLKIADEAIKFGLKNNKVLQVNVDDFPKNLQANGASFVTLEIEGDLRGY